MKKTNPKHHAARRKKPQRAAVKRRQAARAPGRSGRERRRKVEAQAQAGCQAARVAFAAAVERDQLAAVPDFDREWWTSFGLDFFDCQFGEAGEVDGVAYEAHDAHAFEWVRLAEGPHRVVLAIDSRVVHNEDADEAELLLYATTPEALTAIQERAGYPDFAWIDRAG